MLNETVKIVFETDKNDLRRETNFIERELKKLEEAIKIDFEFDTNNFKRNFNTLINGISNQKVDLVNIFNIKEAQKRLNTFIKTINNVSNKPINIDVNHKESKSDLLTPAAIATSAAVQTSATNDMAQAQIRLNKEINKSLKANKTSSDYLTDILRIYKLIENSVENVTELETKLIQDIINIRTLVDQPLGGVQETIDGLATEHEILQDLDSAVVNYAKSAMKANKDVARSLKSIGFGEISIASKYWNKFTIAMNKAREASKLFNATFLTTIKLPAFAGKAFYNVGKSILTQSKALLSSITGIYGKLIAFSGGIGLGFLAKDFLDSAVNAEKLKLTLDTLEGSSKKADKSFSWIKEFATQTPYELNQVTESFIKLRAYGIDPTNGTLKTLGDTASAMGKPLQQGVEALADALTGENERLKEFGIKASKKGEEILYNWTDSSGQARHIIIKNNKDIIQSTLMAIWNEKYQGAMDKQSKALAGIWTNIKDSYTDFQTTIMQGGLFDYIKALSIYIKNFFNTTFDEGKKRAKSASETVINGVKSIIKSIGFMKDVFTGIELALVTGKIAWQEWALFVNKILLSVQEGIFSLSKKMNTTFRDLALKYNDWARVLNLSKLTVPTITTPQESKGLIEQRKIVQNLTSDLKDSNKEFQTLAKSLANEEGVKGADKIISDIDKIRDSLKNINEIKNAPKIGELGEGQFSKVEKAAKKATDNIKKEQKKTAAKIKKERENQIKEAEKDFDELASLFKSSLASIISGDIAGGLSSLFTGLGNRILDDVLDPIANKLSDMWKSMETSMSNLFTNIPGGDILGSLFGGIAGGALGFLGNITGAIFDSLLNTTVSPQEIEAAKGKTEFTDDGLKNLGELYKDAITPLYTTNTNMYKTLRSMDQNFYEIARAFSTQTNQGIDLTGANFVDTFKSGFLGFSSKSIELMGTGLLFSLQKLGDIIDQETLSVKSYTTTLVTKTKWWGLSSKQYIKENYKNLPQSIIDDMVSNLQLGYDYIFESAIQLGFNEDAITQALNQATINLGKIDFTGLSDEEVQNRISQAFSEALSGVVGQIPKLSKLVDQYGKDLETSIETLGRITKEYTSASYQFNLIGKEFNDSTIDVYKEWEVTKTRVVEQSYFGWLGLLTNTTNSFYGGLNNILKGSMFSVDKYTRYTTETYTEMMSGIVEETYTTQMQILDIVKAAGGLESFNDAMQIFIDRFYTDEEKLSMMEKSLAQSFDALNMSVPQTREEFRKLLETMDTSTKEGAQLYGEVLLLAEVFDETQSAAARLKDELGSVIDIYEAWTGSLSYFTQGQKLAYAKEAYDIVKVVDTQTSVDAARIAAEQAMQSTVTKEEYIPYFEKYITALEENQPATVQDVVERLDTIADEIKELQNVTQTASYQEPISTATFYEGAR